MTVVERKIVYAFALIENAKQTLGLAGSVLGNFPYDNGNGDFRNDINKALGEIDNVRDKLDLIIDSVTDWNGSGYPYTLGAGGACE